MKNIGLIGGMSWESSLEYYRIINEEVKNKLGGFHSAECVMYSVDFHDIEQLQHQNKWKEASDFLVAVAQKVEKAGADFLVICTNTMHKMADAVSENTRIPLLHIGDVTAEAVQKEGNSRVGLLGTRFTMEQDFYKGRLTGKYGIDVLIPPEEEREIIHKILYQELCLGEIKKRSRDQFHAIITALKSRGAQGIILGCTEIPLLVDQKDYDIPLYDTTSLHARAAVKFALE
ncbi:MAG: aspartate/glutamate racemase family protein [Candidatus Aminicenantes bacterium]